MVSPLYSRPDFYNASVDLVSAAQLNMAPTSLKTQSAQNVFLRRNATLYDGIELKNIRYFLSAFLYKLQLANYSLEQLWSIRDAIVEENMFAIIQNTVFFLELSDDGLFLQSHILEGFLFQSRSSLEFFMLYVAHLLRTGHEGSMSTKTFYKRLEKAKPEAFMEKAEGIHDYVANHIFGTGKEFDHVSPTNWGTLLTSLRDKIAHKDRINYSMNSPDRIMNDILLDFPTLQGMTYDRFCQAMQNGMWFMICDLFPILYDLEWQAGPYREGMFDS